MSDGVFGALMPVALRHLARTEELPMTPWGFRAYSGPFERFGTDRFTTLGWTLVGVCALNVTAGALLWRDDGRGATLALATTPASFAMATGFALPFLLLQIPIRAALILLGRRDLA